jgi:hypothetical protein
MPRAIEPSSCTQSRAACPYVGSGDRSVISPQIAERLQHDLFIPQGRSNAQIA